MNDQNSLRMITFLMLSLYIIVFKDGIRVSDSVLRLYKDCIKMCVIIVQLQENTAVHQLNWHRSEIYSLLLLPVVHNMDIRHIMSLNYS